MWSINIFLKDLNGVGEGIPLLRHNPAERHRCTAERERGPHAVCGRTAARHLLSCGGDSETAGGKGKP